ncbi:hypothetical protein KR059_004672, partial [Drosophila kikkawai]
MAKKGGAQQLQADLQTDEDLERFIERPGLLVLDIYSDWCGPCLGLVGSLRKMKLEMGGDNMQLAICKSDTITALKRFNKKSEPTWLFVTGGKAVNIMFGSDVPKLVAMVTKELEKLIQKTPRTYYRLDELQPIEVEQQRLKKEAIERAERAEWEIRHKKQVDYLTVVTDSIMENMPDIGVTVFGPQVNRDMFKKLTEPAEALKMQCKERKVVQVTTDQFEVVNFACKNPMSPDVIEQLDQKELLICFWKIDESIGTVPNVLMTYAHELTREREEEADDFHEERVLPPIITTMKIKVEVELKEGEVWVEEVSSEEEQKVAKSKAKPRGKSVMLEELHAEDDEAIAAEEEEEASEEEVTEPGGDPMAGFPSMPDFDMDLDGAEEAVAEDEEKMAEAKEEEEAKPPTRIKTVKMPPIWVPNNRRTHAALIYVFFRGQTTGFLPPDPKPEQPHIIMAFDASKRKEILNVVERHKDEVPLYGYFSSADPEDTELIANSTEKYEAGPHMDSDKIVLKVNKVQSYMMLSLVYYGPSYVSPNVTVGKDEALKFFPEDYKPQEEEVVAEPEKKKKKGKKGDQRDTLDPEAVAAAASAAAAAAESTGSVMEAAGGAPEGGEAAPAEGEEGAAAPTAPMAEGEVPPVVEGEPPEAAAPQAAGEPEVAAEAVPPEAASEAAPPAPTEAIPPPPEAEAEAPASAPAPAPAEA